VAEKTVPIDIGGRGVGRNGILPGADGGGAVHPGFDHVQFADGAGGEQLFCLGIDDGADALAADLKNATGALLRLDALPAFGELLHHGLFAVDVVAGVHGVDGDGGVPVVGCADDDGVDIFTREDFAVVASGEELVAPDFAGAFQASVVNIGDGDDFYTADI